jgi:hypothetical protein
MRYLLALIVVCGLALFMLMTYVSEPGHGVTLRPFAQGVAERAAVQNAAAAGKLHQDPELRELRQAIFNAASRVESSPCDARQRQTLREAVATYTREMFSRALRPPTETVALPDGTVIRADSYFSQQVVAAASHAEAQSCSNG